MALKDRIKEARMSRNYTQKQLANHIGISAAAISAYEKGLREPNIEMLVKIVTALDVTLEYLCQDEIAEVRNEPVQLSDKEIELIEKYRRIDKADKETIERILNV